MDRCTLIERSVTVEGDGEELIDTEVGGVHLNDCQLQPSQACLYCVIWGLCLLIILNSEWINAHSWNKVKQTEVMERI